MTLRQIALISLSILALSGCATNKTPDSTSSAKCNAKADPCNGYTMLNNGLKVLRDSQGKEIAEIDDHYQNLSAVRVYKDKIVVTGDLEFGQMTTILNKDTGETIDAFMHFYLTNPWDEKRPALQSPSGKYLLFRKFHSPFSSEIQTSNFSMVYDLDKSPMENRILDCCVDEAELVVGDIYAGKFFYPTNEDLSCSTCSAYKTQVEDDDKYSYILGNKWDTPKTVLQISYPKAETNDFLIVEETSKGLTQKLLKFEQAKLFDKDGNPIKYTLAMEKDFYMVGFCLKGNTLSITNLKDSSPVAKIVFSL